jgi:hypothetical protein
MLVAAPNTNRHMDPEDVERYSMGTIPEEISAQFEEHLLVCESCRNRVAESDALVRAMRQAAGQIRQQEAAPAHAWRTSLMPLLAAAAVIVAALLFGWSRFGAKPEVAVSLMAMRGGDPMAHAPAGTPLALHPDTTGLPASASYGLEIVDSVGKSVWHGALPGSHVPPQSKGTYFVRIYANGSEPLREYGLLIQ